MPEFVRVQDVERAAGVSRQTLHKWIKRGLLPKPTLFASGRGNWNRWPAVTLRIAQFIQERRSQQFTLDEIEELVRERWSSEIS